MDTLDDHPADTKRAGTVVTEPNTLPLPEKSELSVPPLAEETARDTYVSCCRPDPEHMSVVPARHP